jgi:hypothetical protein
MPKLRYGCENKAAKHKLIDPASSASALEGSGCKFSNHFISAMQINKNDRYMHDFYSEIEFSSELESSDFFKENVKQPAFPQGTELSQDCWPHAFETEFQNHFLVPPLQAERKSDIFTLWSNFFRDFSGAESSLTEDITPQEYLRKEGHNKHEQHNETIPTRDPELSHEDVVFQIVAGSTKSFFTTNCFAPPLFPTFADENMENLWNDSGSLAENPKNRKFQYCTVVSRF